MGTAAPFILMAASSAVDAYGKEKEGQANAEQAFYQSQVAANNQKIADQNAQYALAQGQQQEAAKREQTAQTISMQRATAAASGLDANTGSSLRTQGDIAGLGALDAATIKNNALRTAYGFKVQGLNFGAEAGMLQNQSKDALADGNLAAFGSIVGGASSISNKWQQYKMNRGPRFGSGDIYMQNPSPFLMTGGGT
jgi:hypothetical protein